MTDGEFVTALWTGIGTTATAVGAWLLKWVWTRHKIRVSESGYDDKRQKRRSEEIRTDMAGVVQGWQEIVAEMRGQLNVLTKSLSQFRTDYTQCEIRCAEMKSKVVHLEGENARLQGRVETLEADMKAVLEKTP